MVKLKKKKTASKKSVKAKPVSASIPAGKSKSGDGKTRGKASGLNVSEWWNKAFKVNPKTKLTDAELLSAYRKEFPKRIPQPVGRVRSFYNRGISGLGDGEGEGVRAKVQSVAYDKKGNETPSDWTPIHKPDPKLSKLAKERAAKGWKKKSRKPRIDSVRGVAHVAAGKKKAAKIKAKKTAGQERVERGVVAAGKIQAAKAKKPAGKSKKTIKLKVGKKKAA